MVCAAALEVQRIIEEEDLVKKAHDAGNFLEEQLRETFETHPQVGNIRGRGLFWAVSPGCPVSILPLLQFLRLMAANT